MVVAAGCAPPQASPETLTVFAAASLRSTFAELGARFEDAHPATKVVFNFGGSADLVAQLAQGARADVLATADTRNMTKAVDAGLVSDAPTDFAGNTLTIVAAPANPKGIKGFADLAAGDIQLVVCAPQVPCGSATERIEEATGVALAPVSEESSVTDVLGKITSGQADAGLVYLTDARGAGGKVAEVPFPESGAAVNTYPIAVLARSDDPAGAHTFVDLVTGPDGRAVLTAAGFSTP
nr:molybdate ABC transporter substrate-binding protein [Mycolicibacterium duvalii]